MTPLPPYTHEPGVDDYFCVTLHDPADLQEYLNLASARGWKLAVLAEHPARIGFQVVLEHRKQS